MLQNSATRFRWKSRLAAWKQVDWVLLSLVVGMTLFAGIMIRSAELNQGLTDWWQHWLFGGIGLAMAMLIARSRYENLLQWHWVIYAITNVSLVAVMVMGSSAKGAQRWITIGGFNLQPSEFAKLALIITLAALLHVSTAATLPAFLKALGVTALPWGLIFLQPDLGTSLVFAAITLGMLYWANANPGWLFLLSSPLVSAILFGSFLGRLVSLLPSPEMAQSLAAIFDNLDKVGVAFIEDHLVKLLLAIWIVWTVAMGVVALLTLPWGRWGMLGAIAVNVVAAQSGQIFWGLLKDYQKARLVLFLNPEQDPLGGGYHLIQSRIAIGSGGIWGRGLHQGTQTQLNFIPEQHTDFIFSAVGEELGLIGCILVLIAFWLICWRLIAIARKAKDNFGSLLAVGVLSMIVFQVIVNISMTIGLAPVTGIPLPWFSYGRSALLTNFLALGVVESVANYRQRLKF